MPHSSRSTAIKMEQIVQICAYIKKQNYKNCEEPQVVIITAIMFILQQDPETRRLTSIYEVLCKHQPKVCCIKTHVAYAGDKKQQEDKQQHRKKRK